MTQEQIRILELEKELAELKLKECQESKEVKDDDIPLINGDKLIKMSEEGTLTEPILNKYLNNGGNINYQDKHGYTALIWASSYGDLELVKLLVDKGADIHHQNKWGNTALIWASGYGHIEVVKYLVDKGAKLVHQNIDGETALIWASENGHLEVVKYLVDKGADVHHQNKWGNTALIWASRNGYIEVVKYFKEKLTQKWIKEIELRMDQIKELDKY